MSNKREGEMTVGVGGSAYQIKGGRVWSASATVPLRYPADLPSLARIKGGDDDHVDTRSQRSLGVGKPATNVARLDREGLKTVTSSRTIKEKDGDYQQCH